MQVKCKTVILNPMNARTVRVTGGTTTIKPHKYNEEIVSLEMPNNIVISLGESVTVKKREYKVNLIKELYVGNTLFYELSVAKLTKSSLMVLPMLGGEKKLYFYDNLFVNCFIGFPGHEGCIALLYRWSGDPLFLKFEEAVKKFANFVDTYDISSDLVMFIFDVPKKHTKNYTKFINGKYSEFTDNYKTQILKFHGMNIDGQIGQILFKSEKRKARLEHMLGVTLDDSAELFSIMDDSEVFNPKYYL